MSTTTARRARGRGSNLRRVQAVAGVASLLDSAAIVSVGAALPLWRDSFALDDRAVGLVGFSLTIGVALGALLGGPLSDRCGRRAVFAVSVVLYAVGAALVAVAPSAGPVVLGVVALGLASGSDLPGSIAMVADAAPDEDRGRLVARTQVMWGLGIVLASLMSFVVSPLGVAGMRGVFAVLAATALLTAAVRFQRPTAADPAGPGTVARPAPRPGARPGAVLALLACFYVFYTLVAHTFGTYRTYFLVVTGGAGQSTATAVSLVATATGLVGTVVFTRVVQNRWRRRIYPFGVAGLVGAMTIIAVSGGQPLTVVVLALLLHSLAYPYVGEALYKVWTQESFPPSRRGSAQGVTIAAARIVASAFSVVTPMLLARSPSVLFGLLAGFALVAGLLGALIEHRAPRPTTRVGR